MKSSYRPLGEFIRQVDVRNVDRVTDRVLGINIDKYFMPSVANVIGTDLSIYKLLQKGLFACNPMHVGRDERLPVALYNENIPALVSPAYFMFQVSDKERLNDEYLMMWFRRPEFDRQCWLKTDGSVRGGITWDDICRLSIPIIPYPEQEKIVRQYKTIADRITLKQRINDKLVEILKLDYKKLIQGYNIDSVNLPMGWIIGNIGNYCDVKSGYAFKSEWWTDTGYKVIKIANITNNTIDIDSCDCVAKEHTNKANNYFVQSGDILIAMTGATTGKIGIVPLYNAPIVVNQRVGKFFLGDNPIEKVPFLFATLLNENVMQQLHPEGMAGSAQDNLSPDDIKRISIVMPAISIVNVYNQTHIVHVRHIITNCAEIRTLKKVSEIILQTISSY